MKRNEEIIDAVDHLAEKSLKFLQELVKTPSLEGDEKNCQLIINEKFHSITSFNQNENQCFRKTIIP